MLVSMQGRLGPKDNGPGFIGVGLHSGWGDWDSLGPRFRLLLLALRPSLARIAADPRDAPHYSPKKLRVGGLLLRVVGEQLLQVTEPLRSQTSARGGVSVPVGNGGSFSDGASFEVLGSDVAFGP